MIFTNVEGPETILFLLEIPKILIYLAKHCGQVDKGESEHRSFGPLRLAFPYFPSFIYLNYFIKALSGLAKDK